jgi:dihydrodipicolinate synthase/N-acetylneuraminate lyase
MLQADEIVADPLHKYPVATVACFDPMQGELPRRKLDRQRNQQFLERLADQSADAVLIGASTGHGHLRTTDELADWFESSAKANLQNTIKIALLRPEDGEAESRRLIELLKANNYPIGYVRPGTDLPANASDEAIAENMQFIVQELGTQGLAIGVYSIPDVSGVPLTPHAVAQLVSSRYGDRIVAVKVTEANYEQSTARFLAEPSLRHLKIVQGWDPHLATALQADPLRCGVTSGPMSFAIFQYQHILASARRQDSMEVTAAQQAVSQVFASMQDDPSKFADLQRAKFMMGLGNPQLGTVSDAQCERVFGAIERLPRDADRQRIARSIDLMGDGPFHERLVSLSR